MWHLIRVLSALLFDAPEILFDFRWSDIRYEGAPAKLFIIMVRFMMALGAVGGVVSFFRYLRKSDVKIQGTSRAVLKK